MATFIEEETQTDTNVGFGFNRTNQLDNQLDFSSAVPYTSYSPYQTQQETEVDEPEPSYTVEQEYKINGLPEDEVIVPTFMPVLKSEKKETPVYDYKLKLNARGKIMATVFGVVVSILVAFMIYNAVTIARLSNSLDYLQAEQISSSASVTQQEMKYQSLASDDNYRRLAGEDGLGFSEGGSFKINLQQRPEIENPQTSTNWFNNLCEFFSNLFN